MRKVIVIVSLLMVCVAVVLSLPLQEKIAQLKIQHRGVEHDSSRIDQQLRTLKSFKDSPIMSLGQYCSQWRHRLEHDADNYALKVRLQLVKNQKNAQQVLENEYLGIRKQEFKIFFYQVTGKEDILRILKYFNLWQQEFPIQLSQVLYSDNNIQITGGIYGL